MKWHWSIFFLFGFIMFAGCASPQINEVVHPPDEATKIPTTTSSPVPVATATVEIALVSDVTSLPASPTASFAASPSEPVLGSLADAGQYWINTYGGPGNDAGKLILTTQDGGILIVSESDSFNRYPQTWLIKLAPNGSVLWQRAYDVHAGKVIETANGDIVVIGSNHMVRLDAEGNILWAKFNTFFGERYGDLLLFEEDTNGQLIVWNAEGGRMVMDANGEILRTYPKIMMLSKI